MLHRLQSVTSCFLSPRWEIKAAHERSETPLHYQLRLNSLSDCPRPTESGFLTVAHEVQPVFFISTHQASLLVLPQTWLWLPESVSLVVQTKQHTLLTQTLLAAIRSMFCVHCGRGQWPGPFPSLACPSPCPVWGSVHIHFLLVRLTLTTLP